MNLKTTVILLLVCVGLMAALWLIPDIDHRQDTPGASRPLFRFPPDDVTRLELRRSDGSRSVLVRGEDGWRLELDGLTVRADERRVRDIIDGLENLVPDKTIDEGDVGDRDQYGLTDELFVIELTLANGTEHRLTIGIPHGRGYHYACTDPEGAVYLISSTLRNSADVPQSTLRDGKPVGLRDSDVKTLEVRRGEDTVMSARFDPADLKWKLTAPGLEVRGFRDAIEDLRLEVTDLTVLEPGGFVSDAPEDLAAFGLAGEGAYILLTAPETGTTRGILIGKSVEDEQGEGFFWMVDGEPSVYRSERSPDSALIELLSRPVDDYRDPNLLQLDFADPNFLEIGVGDSRIRLVKGDFDWMFEQPGGEIAANNKEVEWFVRELKRLEVVRPADDVKPEDADFAGGEARTARLVIRLEGQEEASVFEVGRRVDEEGWYVMRPWKPRIVVATAAFIDLLRKPWYEFRHVDVTKVPRMDVTALEVRRGETVESARRVPSEETTWAWEPAEGVEGKAREEKAIRPLLAHLDPLRAVTYVGQTTAAKDLEAFGLAVPEVEITATLEQKDETRRITLRIAAAEEGAPHHATLTGAGREDGLVFTISDEVFKILTEPLIQPE